MWFNLGHSLKIHKDLYVNYKPNGYVVFDGERYAINAKAHQISGYSAHAGQWDLLNFIKRMRVKPKKVHLVHGDDVAKQTLKELIEMEHPECEVVIPI
ncbi:MBL fold metallo-hydrolase RNA specificity domain-containing protein [Marinomonas transparens]|uniref:MBL fold metallo-hydrolase RNA specificity domain-containing protein n=1 Tax=Marinomonas transparens TaxID=2795388 RepID=UPI001F1AD0AB|nr:MBL fold metallo-hydrolase RNA specificity domain-containing protein [Marinomonas transparens]